MIVFRMWGTKVCLHFSFFAMLCFFFQLGGKAEGCLAAALIHEAGHLFAFAVQRAAPKELHFQFGGIRLVPPDCPLPFRGELMTLAGGSLSSFLGGAILTMINKESAVLHFVTGGFSLLPVPGLDGGEIFSLVWSRFFPGRERLCGILQRVIAFLLAAAALSLGRSGVLPAAAILLAGACGGKR